ncbi:TMV RESISTANCE PROTEIN N-LIKE [Salix koriyanagi]|uniref:TMV RESISTANCE PROTEIN N-LIKE n=1 Tax=Salix koriyanagi TaxID=2511006 RepID=A0A9Q0Q9C7_9ROSI|nr:TMV RESISTANCE PROTEIN N-LIKE [Salix koriyanagi]
MRNLKLLHLNNVKLGGSYVNFPKSLVWLCWRGFSLDCLPNDLFLKDLVVLDLSNSSLKQVWNGIRVWKLTLLVSVQSLWTWALSRKSLLSATFTPLFLPDSLMKLTVSDCNLEDLGILDLSRLRSLEYLDLSGNPICNLPDSMNGLTILKSLLLHRCTRLQSLPQLPESLMRLIASNYGSSERISNLQNLLGPLEMNTFNHHKLIEGRGVFKLEPLRNFVVEMIKMVRMFNMASVRNIEVTRSTVETSTQRKLSIQIFHDLGTSSIFLPGSDVPYFFYVRTESCQTTFHLPQSFGWEICGLNICVAYACINPEAVFDNPFYAKIRIQTKGLLWEYTPEFFGFPEASEDMLWLCHWKFKDWFKA